MTTPVTSILADEALVSVRYADTRPFAAFATRAQRPGTGLSSGTEVMLGLMEAMIDRTADVLERVGAETDRLSQGAFAKGAAKASRKKRDLEEIITQLGQEAELSTKVQGGLLGPSRALAWHATVVPKADRQSRRSLEQAGHGIGHGRVSGTDVRGA